MAGISCNLIADGHAPFTVLYIYGPMGCGKTAMLDYLESEMFSKAPNKLVGRIRASELNDKDWSERNDIIKNAETCDLFIMDDFNYLDKTQQVISDLYLMINNMHTAGKKIVITGDRPIDEYPEIFPSMFLSRMKWEMLAKINPPKVEDCLNALRQAAKETVDCKQEVLENIFKMIVSTEGNNLGSILATFRRIVVRAQMNNLKLTSEFASNVIYDGAEIELLGA